MLYLHASNMLYVNIYYPDDLRVQKLSNSSNTLNEPSHSENQQSAYA